MTRHYYIMASITKNITGFTEQEEKYRQKVAPFISYPVCLGHVELSQIF